MSVRRRSYLALVAVSSLLLSSCGLLVSDEMSAPGSTEPAVSASGESDGGGFDQSAAADPAPEEGPATTLAPWGFDWCEGLDLLLNSSALAKVEDIETTRAALTLFRDTLGEVADETSSTLAASVIEFQAIVDELLVSTEGETDPAVVESEMQALVDENADLITTVVLVTTEMCGRGGLDGPIGR